MAARASRSQNQNLRRRRHAEKDQMMSELASADGKYLYFAQRRGPFSYNSMLPQWEIKRKDRKTGDEDTIIQQSLSAFRPALSPDGRTLLYVSRYETESGLRM